MKNTGVLLITLAFLVGSYLSVLDAETVNWPTLGVCLLLGAVGVYFFNAGKREEATHEEKVAGNLDTITRSLDALAEKTRIINEEKGSIYTYDVCNRLDADLIDHLNDFVDARKTIGTVYGLDAYAEVMNHYAAAERYANRVWSASADGYIDEVNIYLEKTAEQFQQARDVLARHKRDGKTLV